MQRTTNDWLLKGAHLYYQLVLQDVLLQIRIKAVETSEALVEKNAIQFQFGANTQLDLLQAQTQLANDKQALISQQVARRKAAVALATNLNLAIGEDLLLSDRFITQQRLVDDKSKVQDLVQIAIDNRPELKKWEQQKLAAKDAIRVAFAPLLPQVIGSSGLSTTGAKVGRQQLKVATIRLEEGVGTDLDVVNAQRDYTNALTAKAKALVQFNEAQIQLLRATGRMSVNALLGK